MQDDDTSDAPDGRTPDELSREQLLHEIIAVVAEAKGCHPLELRPIAEVVNLEAVEAVLENPNTAVSLGFEYEDGFVRVSEQGIDYEPKSP